MSNDHILIACVYAFLEVLDFGFCLVPACPVCPATPQATACARRYALDPLPNWSEVTLMWASLTHIAPYVTEITGQRFLNLVPGERTANASVIVYVTDVLGSAMETKDLVSLATCHFASVHALLPVTRTKH